MGQSVTEVREECHAEGRRRGVPKEEEEEERRRGHSSGRLVRRELTLLFFEGRRRGSSSSVLVVVVGARRRRCSSSSSAQQETRRDEKKLEVGAPRPGGGWDSLGRVRQTDVGDVGDDAGGVVVGGFVFLDDAARVGVGFVVVA